MTTTRPKCYEIPSVYIALAIRRRCALPSAHGGTHLMVRTTLAPMLGECSKTECAAERKGETR